MGRAATGVNGKDSDEWGVGCFPPDRRPVRFFRSQAFHSRLARVPFPGNVDQGGVVDDEDALILQQQWHRRQKQ